LRGLFATAELLVINWQYVEQELCETEGATQLQLFTGSAQLMQQQLTQSDETKAASFQQLSPLHMTSLLLTVSILGV